MSYNLAVPISIAQCKGISLRSFESFSEIVAAVSSEPAVLSEPELYPVFR